MRSIPDFLMAGKIELPRGRGETTSFPRLKKASTFPAGVAPCEGRVQVTIFLGGSVLGGAVTDPLDYLFEKAQARSGNGRRFPPQSSSRSNPEPSSEQKPPGLFAEGKGYAPGSWVFHEILAHAFLGEF